VLLVNHPNKGLTMYRGINMEGKDIIFATF
jgi:hypothetical protein